ncbi:23S rRNA (uracil(747)-C(5))-methyltransferase RlmC [Demequina zhanjiangensis]|uniref:23S rRNA (Uracil(747)-C(5))-methyltransferase RlmC n=1 Tax=Demequina zhanjiangensis TaxID=3051659 RepID=A0ABT8G4M1_9MICO|nr:23S rRNA (uracil(747)-C(5))-methyltransferase RlmC [Demequina sp. SYSU T00b26]MDN4474089.1 23S rRNA (uracil(747)-C(5))-methyltransferase RlmC [Demequina sp. SYSU T00b26]
MQCDYFDAGVCRSCALLETPYARQLADKDAAVRATMGTTADGAVWLPPVASAEEGFRTKAKMVVGGTVEAPTLGILDMDGGGVDLQGCHLYPDALSAAFAPLADFITLAALEPYDLTTRRGELKNLLVTVSPDSDLMVRFVMRSTEALARLRKHLPSLQRALPTLTVASLNVLPEHKAVVEGDREIPLTAQESLPMRLDDVTLHLRPQSFFQTNTDVARALYRQAEEWIDAAAPADVWDLYCGVGGFALHALAPGRDVLGVEVSEQAIASAALTRDELVAAGRPGAADARFLAADATAFALAQDRAPELVVVNPPRRGIGPALAGWLDRSEVRTVVYSSCHPGSLARDLAAMPSWMAREIRVMDMFPHTAHAETAVLLQRA